MRLKHYKWPAMDNMSTECGVDSSSCFPFRVWINRQKVRHNTYTTDHTVTF